MHRFQWLPWRRARPIDESMWRQAVARAPLAQALSDGERGTLRELVSRFIAHKRFHAVDMELDATQRLLIAMQACVPMRRPGLRALRGWRSVIVYPGMFKAERAHHDRRTGVVTEGGQVMIGEAWMRGPLVLSWANIERDLTKPWLGFNVAVHEIAHKLDMLDGSVDGMPPLPKEMSCQRWVDVFQSAYDRLRATRDRGEPTPIDSYAATNPGEYFAVVSELHFSDPGRLARAEPDVAALLTDYYGPSPAPVRDADDEDF
jgi:Mlc titration factor MtfA (ptsG expression regulator)